MKVIILHPPLYPMNHDLFNLLGKYVDLTVYCFGEHPRLHTSWSIYDFKKDAKNYRIKVFGKGAITIKIQLNRKAFSQLFRDKPDIVMSVAFWIPSLYSSLLKKIIGFKFIVITDAIPATETNASKARIFIRKIICKNTDILISASDLTTDYIKLLAPKTTIRKSLQTLDVLSWIEDINSLPGKKVLREKLKLPEEKQIILGVGNFISRKNWESVFKIITKINETVFVLIGDGVLEKGYKKYLEDNNLQEQVFLIPRKNNSDIKEYYRASDMFILPSYQDQFGYVVVEALCSGLPVICSKGAGASTLIEDGYNGFVIEPDEDFSFKVKQILLNLETMQNNARLSMLDHTLEKKALEYKNILEEIVS